MKVIMGPAPCASCGAKVTVVRRDVVAVLPGDPAVVTIPDAEWVVVDAEGERHQCGGTRP